MQVTIDESNMFGPLSETQLTTFEARIGSALPRAYRDFLLTHNGGRPEPSQFFINAEQGSSSLQWLYGIHDGPSWASLQQAFDTYRERLPGDLLAIGNDEGGNLICLAVRGHHAGAIYFWDHEGEGLGTASDAQNLYLITESFSEFIGNLTATSFIDSTILEQACQLGEVDTLREYISEGGDINLHNEYGQSLAMIAAMYGQLGILQILVEHGADITGSLSIAAQNGQVKTVAYLLSSGANKEEVVDGRADTPLMRAARFGHQETVETLITCGADTNAKNKFGQTALMQASWAEHKKIIELLKEAGAK